MRCFEPITSRENSLIKLACALRSSADKRRENGLYILEGLRSCTDARDNAIRFDKLIVSETALNKYAGQLSALAECAEGCFAVPDTLFRKISDTENPQGVMAVIGIPSAMRTIPDKDGRYIALENIADPSNIGAVARSCEALGVSGIIFSRGCCDPYSPKALRASMGTLLRVPLIFPESFSEIFSWGLLTAACVVDRDAQPITATAFRDGCALLIGNEANGLTDETKRLADIRTTIPMRGRAESLNAAAAAAIAMWEMMRRGQ